MPSTHPLLRPHTRRARVALMAVMAAGATVLGAPTSSAAAPPSGGVPAEVDQGPREGGAPATGKPRASRVRVPDVLERIAECESRGDPTAVSADGRHRGKYQFSLETWRALGGVGDPAAAPEVEQDRLAVELYRREGAAPWPHCGRAALEDE